MVNSRGTHVRELAWTVAGASAGSLARHWVDPIWPGSGRALANTLVLTAAAAVLVGFALAASVRAPMKTVLVAAGGAAGSISIATARAAAATPEQSAISLAAFFVAAIGGLVLGTMMASSAGNHEREERY